MSLLLSILTSVAQQHCGTQIPHVFLRIALTWKKISAERPSPEKFPCACERQLFNVFWLFVCSFWLWVLEWFSLHLQCSCCVAMPMLLTSQSLSQHAFWLSLLPLTSASIPTSGIIISSCLRIKQTNKKISLQHKRSGLNLGHTSSLLTCKEEKRRGKGGKVCLKLVMNQYIHSLYCSRSSQHYLINPPTQPDVLSSWLGWSSLCIKATAAVPYPARERGFSAVLLLLYFLF